MSVINMTKEQATNHTKILPLIATLCGPNLIQAEEVGNTYQFSIPSQSVEQALLLYSDQSGVQVLFKTSDVEYLKSQEVNGTFTRAEALERLLKGGKLAYRFTAKNTLIVYKQNEKPTNRKRNILAAVVGLFVGSGSQALLAQGSIEDTHNNGLEEIVVTAQKRQQNINSVPMSITAVTGQRLQEAGINDVSDLVKITPGLQVGLTPFGTPVFTLRGVGFDDFSLGNNPAVTVYLDESPIPYPPLWAGVGFDVERVEVLKGPQGTLFGSNSTGGAISYISAKPTDSLEMGGNMTYGRFDRFDIDGYVSGPITDNLGIRVAAQQRGGGAWQRSFTRDDKLGDADFTNGRVTLEWDPTSALRTQLTINRWIDRSEAPAPQLIGFVPAIPAFFSSTGLEGYPTAPLNSRSADWDSNKSWRKNDRYFQAFGRIEWDLSSEILLTSISNYIDYDRFLPLETDGTAIPVSQTNTTGSVKVYGQELRLNADFDRITALVGGSYQKNEIAEQQDYILDKSTVSYSFVGLGGERWTTFSKDYNQDTETYAVFGSAEFAITDALSIQGGARYTSTNIDYSNCTRDSGDGVSVNSIGVFANFRRQLAGLQPVTFLPGECFTLDSNLEPTRVFGTLKEDNVSWRLGTQYEGESGYLLYANVSKGYKSGSFPDPVATTTATLVPVRQESLLAYEAGFKTSLFDHRVQLNGAAFYYDYNDKQVFAVAIDPVVGRVGKLFNLPKSEIYGVELSLDAKPLAGLTVNLAGTYLESKLKSSFVATNVSNILTEFQGSRLPYVPNWQMNGNVEYRWNASNEVVAFASISGNYQSELYTILGEQTFYRVKPRAIFDLRIGVESADGKLRASIWGRNIFNKYYWNQAWRQIDTDVRYLGMPATYGITLSYEYD